MRTNFGSQGVDTGNIGQWTLLVTRSKSKDWEGVGGSTTDIKIQQRDQRGRGKQKDLGMRMIASGHGVH